VTGAVVSAVAAVLAALVTGWMAWRAKRIEAAAPVSIAGGYTLLVTDMQRMVDALKADLAQQHVQIAELRVAVDKAIASERRCMERLAAVSQEVDKLRAALAQHQEEA
jgi:hypothetical protein